MKEFEIYEYKERLESATYFYVPSLNVLFIQDDLTDAARERIIQDVTNQLLGGIA